MAVLGVSADIAGLGTVLVVGAPTVIGFIAGSVTAALATAVAMLLLVLLALLNVLRRTGRDNRRLWRLVHEHNVSNTVVRTAVGTVIDNLQDALDDVPAVPPSPEDVSPVALLGDTAGTVVIQPNSQEPVPSTWLPNPADLSTFAMTAEDFEVGRAKALELARPGLGQDVRARFRDVMLYCEVGPTHRLARNTPYLSYVVLGKTAGKYTVVTFKGSTDAVTLDTRALSKSSLPPLRVESPWADDRHWLDLVHASWLRARRVDGTYPGTVVLSAASPRFTGTRSPWLCTYATGGVFETFVFNDGILEQLTD
jgi:hypothetical protein